MISEKYKKTHEAYCKLGKRYIENSESINLLKLPEFIGLLTKGGKVLDVGCAGGRDSKKFAAAGFDVTGIDIVDVFIEEAGKRVPKASFCKLIFWILIFRKMNLMLFGRKRFCFISKEKISQMCWQKCLKY